MRIVMLSTTARVGSEMVEDLRRRLEAPGAELVLVLVTRPAERLPVERCLVVGPAIRPRRSARDFPFVRGGGTTSRLDRADRALVRRIPGLRGNRRLMLATGVLRSPEVRAEVERADMVVAADFNATWAAWKLARRVAGPAFLFQPEGAAAHLARQADGGVGQ